MANLTDPRDIIIAPVVSEKSYGLMEQNVYTFFVNREANKTQIKIAIEQIFDVKPPTTPTTGEAARSPPRAGGYGQRKATKRAIVTLREGTIDIFGGSAA